MYCRNFLKISLKPVYITTQRWSSPTNVLIERLASSRGHFSVMAYKNFRNKKGEMSELRHVKYQSKRAGKVSPPGNIEVQVVSIGAPGTPRALIINMDHFKYLFNCGEGTQRISMEHRMKIAKIQEIFITRHSWDNIGGLLGMCLSLESMNVPNVRIHGPPNVEKLVTMSKGFAKLHRIRVEKPDHAIGYYSDSAIHVDYIHLLPQLPSDKSESVSVAENDMAMAYLCQPHPRPQNICFEKCVDLGIPRGPAIGQLKNGQEITLPNGRVVKPEDVLDDPDTNQPFIVLECPTKYHIPALTHCDSLRNASPQLIVHMTPHTVLASPEYQAWMAQYSGDTTTHLVMNDSCSGLVYEGVYRIQTQLGMIHDGIFPALPEPKQASAEETSGQSENVKVILAETNLKFSIRSKNKGVIDREGCIRLDPEEFRETVLRQDDFTRVLNIAKDQLAQNKTEGAPRYPELLFLGTGSAIPNKVRNVSGILLNLSEDQCILLDCGENTLGQLIRHYGDTVGDVLARLSTIFVSHLHADHHLGIISVVRERQRVLEARGREVSPVTVVAPTKLDRWYHSLEELHTDIGRRCRVIPVEVFHKNPPEGSRDVYEKFIAGLNMKEVEMVRVLHAQYPHGVVLTHHTGWKLVYSGDTMPCASLVDAGKDCDVLIHEATMEDDLVEEAQAKKHSTTSQAIQIGLDMSAKFILLTHFSQRYAKVPLFNDNFSNRVGIAFDNMRVSLSELPLIPYFLPVLKSMFADQYAEMEERTLKRSYKKAAEGGDNGENPSKRHKAKGKWGRNPQNFNQGNR